LDGGIDPALQRRAAKQAGTRSDVNTFRAVAKEWFTHYCQQKAQSKHPLAPATVTKTQWLLNLSAYRTKEGKDEAPHPLKQLMERPITSVTKADIAAAIGGLKRRDNIETARRVLDRLDRVFRYAVGTGRMELNPAAAFRDSADPRDKLPAVAVRNHPAITEPTMLTM
jgi:hypothetical protein